MKKKLLATLLAVMSVFLLVACSSKDDLSGKYYRVSSATGDTKLVLNINGSNGVFYADGEHEIFEIDRDSKVITYSDSGSQTINYSLSDDGTLEYSGYVAGKDVIYKENSEALKEAIEDAKDDD